MDVWLMEGLRGIGRILINPLFYWIIILGVCMGLIRMRRERRDFGTKVFGFFSEFKGTWKISLFTGLLISAAFIGAGIVLSPESLFVLAIVTIIWSIFMKSTMLSPIYTVGATCLLLYAAPMLNNSMNIGLAEEFLDVNLIAFGLLLGILLITEAILLMRVKRNETFPGITKSDRGVWVGKHHVRKLSVVPFITLIPMGDISPFADWWPVLSIGGATYGLVLFPFLLGFDFLAKGHHPVEAKQKLGKFQLLLGMLVLFVAAGAFYNAVFTGVAVIIGLLGREYLNYRYRRGDDLRRPFFSPDEKGLKIVGILPDTPAEHLDIYVGEIISKVNGQRIKTEEDFYHALQNSGAYFKLEILNDSGENRFEQGAFFEGDHHELGLLFPKEPFRSKDK